MRIKKDLRESRERINRRYENKYFPKVKKEIDKEIDRVISAVQRGGIGYGIKVANERPGWDIPQVIKALYKEVGLGFARRTWIDLREQQRNSKSLLACSSRGKVASVEGAAFTVKGFGFIEEWVRIINNYLSAHLIEKIVFKVSETTRDVLLNVLYKATENGWGVEETVRELNDLPLSKTQAARIVRTEVGRAANAGTMAAGETFEFEQTKEWIAAQDRRTRGQRSEDHADHYHLDGITIDYDNLFIDPRNGAGLRFPGDPEAPAENSINCRCTVAVVAKIGSDGRLIRKK